MSTLLMLDNKPILQSVTDCKKIVIVGGGVSGLAAASHLFGNGMCNITILEAGDRLGGRLRSDRFHGALVQRGAQFIHGETNNPVYDVSFYRPIPTNILQATYQRDMQSCAHWSASYIQSNSCRPTLNEYIYSISNVRNAHMGLRV